MGLIGKKKVQELLGDCSVGTIYRLEKKGLLPAKKTLPGGRIALWDEVEMQACIRSLAQTSAVMVKKIGSGKPGPGRGNRKLAE